MFDRLHDCTVAMYELYYSVECYVKSYIRRAKSLIANANKVFAMKSVRVELSYV